MSWSFRIKACPGCPAVFRLAETAMVRCAATSISILRDRSLPDLSFLVSDRVEITGEASSCGPGTMDACCVYFSLLMIGCGPAEVMGIDRRRKKRVTHTSASLGMQLRWNNAWIRCKHTTNNRVMYFAIRPRNLLLWLCTRACSRLVR
jgi:hypothetical protein